MAPNSMPIWLLQSTSRVERLFVSACESRTPRRWLRKPMVSICSSAKKPNILFTERPERIRRKKLLRICTTALFFTSLSECDQRMDKENQLDVGNEPPKFYHLSENPQSDVRQGDIFKQKTT